MNSIQGPYVSADGHFVEPADLWLQRMDKRFRDRAPRIEARDDGDWVKIDGLKAFPVGLDGAAMEDKIAGEIKEAFGRRHADTRPGASNPQARMKDHALDHIRAEVLYPGSFGCQFWSTSDADYQAECCRVYNDWVSEFCSADTQRFLGAALIPMRGPIELAVKETQRAAKLKGIRTLAIPTTMGAPGYSDPHYEPLWAALQDADLPVSIHGGTTGDHALVERLEGLGMGLTLIESKLLIGQRGVAELLWAAIPQHFPKLRFALAENGIGWIPTLLSFMDHWWTDHHRWMKPELKEKPSYYFNNQFWASFEEDRAGVILAREGILNPDHVMWGSDYPHTEGTFPHSREAITRDFAGVPEALVHKLVVSNAAKLYRLDN